MATATLTGTIAYPTVTGGANTSVILGAPTITSSDTTGPQLTYNEGGANSYKIVTGAPVAIPFGTVASADMVYVGTDAAIQVVLNGGTDTFNIAADGAMMFYKAGITAITITATPVDANVVVALLGD